MHRRIFLTAALSITADTGTLFLNGCADIR